MDANLPEFSEVLRLLARLKTEHVIDDYAIGGAVAMSLWDEPVATQDLDVVVTVTTETHALGPLRPLFDWLGREGLSMQGEHAMISGVPVQFLVAWSPLVTAAVKQAKEIPYDPDSADGPIVRLIQPTYLVAMWQADPAANSPRRRERIARLREAGLVDEALLTALLSSQKP